MRDDLYDVYPRHEFNFADIGTSQQGYVIQSGPQVPVFLIRCQFAGCLRETLT